MKQTIKKWGLLAFWISLMSVCLYATEFMAMEGPMNILRIIVALCFLSNFVGCFFTDKWTDEHLVLMEAYHTKFFHYVQGWSYVVLIACLVYFAYWGSAFFLFLAICGGISMASDMQKQVKARDDKTVE